MANYNNIRAMRALIRASLQSIFKSPSAIVFTVAFPLIFILVFGFLGNNGGYSIKVTSSPGSDTSNMLYQVLRYKVQVIKWIPYKDSATTKKLLQQGDITAVINIKHREPIDVTPEYNILLSTVSTQADRSRQLENILHEVLQRMDPLLSKRMADLAKIDTHVSEVREYKTIDFILPGQLSFSLLASGVFGTAFVFFNLRQTLVLKRFFATPVRREVIVISEGIARMLFQIIGSIVIISLGNFAFGFTLSHGIITFLEMLIMCALGLMIFMGFGFIISGVAKSESAIPPLCNLITLPQFLLAGTFFSIDNFPKWLQPICKALPLSYLNDALRKISFDGASLWDVHTDIVVLLCWGIGLYLAAGKAFRWE